MPERELRLVKRSAEFIPKDDARLLARRLRGIYVLYKMRRNEGRAKSDVLYVGMATAGRRGGLRSRLMSHELEGLFRHIYRKDSAANALNIQRGFKKARRVRDNDLSKWHGARQ